MQMKVVFFLVATIVFTLCAFAIFSKTPCIYTFSGIVYKTKDSKQHTEKILAIFSRLCYFLSDFLSFGGWTSPLYFYDVMIKLCFVGAR